MPAWGIVRTGRGAVVWRCAYGTAIDGGQQRGEARGAHDSLKMPQAVPAKLDSPAAVARRELAARGAASGAGDRCVRSAVFTVAGAGHVRP